MKEYKTPTVSSISLGYTEIDGKDYEVVGWLPVVTAVAAAVGAVAAAAQAVQQEGKNYMDYQPVGKLDKVQ